MDKQEREAWITDRAAGYRACGVAEGEAIWQAVDDFFVIYPPDAGDSEPREAPEE